MGDYYIILSMIHVLDPNKCDLSIIQCSKALYLTMIVYSLSLNSLQISTNFLDLEVVMYAVRDHIVVAIISLVVYLVKVISQ